MKSISKKILSLLVALLLASALSIPAFAEDPLGGGSSSSEASSSSGEESSSSSEASSSSSEASSSSSEESSSSSEASSSSSEASSSSGEASSSSGEASSPSGEVSSSPGRRGAPLMGPLAIGQTTTLVFDGDGVTGDGGALSVTNDGTTWRGTGFSWVPSTGALTLTNFEWVTSAATAVEMRVEATIALNGTSTITSTYSGGATNSYGVYNPTGTAITISGAGALNATSGTGDNISSAIYAIAVSVNSGTVNATGGPANDYSSGIDGLNLSISGGTVNAAGGTATNYESSGARSNTITISGGGVLNATGGICDAVSSGGISRGSYGVFNGLNIYGGTVSASGNTRALNNAPANLPGLYRWWANTTTADPGGEGALSSSAAYTFNTTQKYVRITEEAQTGILVFDGSGVTGDGGALGITNDGITWTGTGFSWVPSTGALTLTNFEWVTPASTAVEIMVDANIVLNGTNTIRSTYAPGAFPSYGIAGHNPITIAFGGTGTLDVASGISENTESHGISVASMVVNSGTLNITAGAAREYSTGISTGSFTMHGGTVNTRGGTATECASCGLLSTLPITITGGVLNAIGGTCTAVSDKFFYGSYGVCTGTLTSDVKGVNISGGTISASGNTRALSNAPTALPALYRWWANTTTADPGGEGTLSSSAAYAFNATQKYVLIAAPNTAPTNVTFTATQTGGASGTANSTGIVLTFSQAVAYLTAGDITVASGTGGVTKGALTGSGTRWTLALAGVQAQGDVTLSVADFGTFHVTSGPQTVAVYKNTQTPGKTLAVGTQNGTLTAGTAGSATYTVTTENIANGAAITLNNPGAVPGITLAAAATTGGSTPVTIHTTAATPAGTHQLTLTADGVTSPVFTLFVGEAGHVFVSGITLSGGTAITTKGGTLQLAANITPQAASNTALLWAVVSGGGSATVNAGGLVTATANGTVVIRATAQDGSGVYGEITITITGQSGAPASDPTAPTAPTTARSPQTGDNSNMGLWALMLAASLLAGALLTFGAVKARRKRGTPRR